MMLAFTVVIHLPNRDWEGGYIWAENETDAKHKLYEWYPKIKEFIPDIVTWEIGGEVVGDVVGAHSGLNESFEPYLVYLQLDSLMKDLEEMAFAGNINWRKVVSFFDAKHLDKERDELITMLSSQRPGLLR